MKTAVLLVFSNLFTDLRLVWTPQKPVQPPWYIAALLSWAVAFFEYMLRVPANRIGARVLSLGQLKIMQEVITLSVFVPFSILYMGRPLKLDFLWASLCILGAAFFIFRNQG